MKLWNRTLYGLGIIPLGFIVSLLSFYLHAVQILGRFPSYGQPDPKKLNIYYYYAPFVNWTAGIWFISFFVWLIMTTTYIITKRRQLKWQLILFGAIGQAVAISLLMSDIYEWFLD